MASRYLDVWGAGNCEQIREYLEALRGVRDELSWEQMKAIFALSDAGMSMGGGGDGTSNAAGIYGSSLYDNLVKASEDLADCLSHTAYREERLAEGLSPRGGNWQPTRSGDGDVPGEPYG